MKKPRAPDKTRKKPVDARGKRLLSIIPICYENSSHPSVTDLEGTSKLSKKKIYYKSSKACYFLY